MSRILGGSLLRETVRRARKLAFRLIGKRWQVAYVRWRSPTTFIAVTGSSGKTVTSGLLSHILSGLSTVQTQMYRNFATDHAKTLRAKLKAEDFYVGEFGAHPLGTLEEAIRLVKPSVGIVTLVALEHKGAFRTIEAVAKEKSKLVQALPARGLAILNQDDPWVAAMAQCTKARVVTFGQSGADYLVSEVACPAPEALSQKVTHQGQTFELTTRLTGTHQSVAVAAAFACAHQLGVPPTMIRDRIASFEQVFARCSVHRVENGPVFIVDTAKAPNHSLQLAFAMVASFVAPRKRIVIGNISDTTGGSDGQRFKRVYRAASAIADQVIFIGDHAHRAAPQDITAGRLVVKRSVQEAAAFLHETALPDEIILLKSSAGLHLERLMLNQIDTVRCWEEKCGRDICVQLNGAGCGLYALPFEQHRTNKQRKLLRQERDAGGADS